MEPFSIVLGSELFRQRNPEGQTAPCGQWTLWYQNSEASSQRPYYLG